MNRKNALRCKIREKNNAHYLLSNFHECLNNACMTCTVKRNVAKYNYVILIPSVINYRPFMISLGRAVHSQYITVGAARANFQSTSRITVKACGICRILGCLLNRRCKYMSRNPLTYWSKPKEKQRYSWDKVLQACMWVFFFFPFMWWKRSHPLKLLHS